MLKIFGLCHGAQHYAVDKVAYGDVLYHAQQAVIFRRLYVFKVAGELEAQHGGKVGKRGHLFRQRLFVHAVYERVCALGHIPCHRLVGAYHKFLYYAVGYAARIGDYLVYLAVLAQQYLYLRYVKVNRAAASARVCKQLAKLVHKLKLRHKLGVLRARGSVAL